MKSPSEDLPLHIACLTPGTPMETITRLIDMWPESIQVRSSLGYLPLHAACRENAQNAELIAFLMAKWPLAVREAYPTLGRLPLHLACRAHGSLTVLQMLIDAYVEAVLVPDVNGFLPLHYACWKRKGSMQISLEQIKLLVEKMPESLHIQTNLGMLPLHWACFSPISSTNVIRYLVKSNPATAFVRDHKGRLPLHLACAETTGGPPFEVIQCLVQAWPESIHIPKGDANFHITFLKGEREDRYKSGDDLCGSQQALALDLVCNAFCLEGQAQPSPELLLLLTNEMPPLHFACAHTWIDTQLRTIQYLSMLYLND